MKRQRQVCSAVLLYLAGVLGLAGGALAEDKISPNLARPMAEAQQAIKKRQWDQGLKKLAEAEALSPKTAYDQYQITEFRAYILNEQKKYADVAKVYEQGLATVPAGKLNERLKTLVSLHSRIGNYPKVIEFGERLLKAGNVDTNTRFAIASAHYQTKNYKRAVAIMQDTIRMAERSGRPVPQDWLLMVRQSQQQLRDYSGAAKTMEKLVRLYPKAEYWEYLLSSRLAQSNVKERVEINLVRLQSYVGALKTPREYLNMAELLLVSGFPVEAKTVLQRGLDARAFDASASEKAKATRYVDKANAAAVELQQSLPKLEQGARSPGGEGDVALGMAHAGLGQYDKAAVVLARGLKEGGVRDPQQAQVMLGISQLRSGNKADAIKTFNSVKDPDQNMVDVAQLWALAASSNAAPAGQEVAKSAKRKGS